MNLYEFTGTPTSRYLTSNKLPVTVAGQVYTPLAIRRSLYRLDPLKTKTNMTILFPGDDQWARELILPNEYKVTVKIKSLSGVIFWSGRLLEISVQNDKKIRLVFRPLETVKGVLGERRYFQHNCPYVLYGDKCRASLVYDTARVDSFDNTILNKIAIRLVGSPRSGVSNYTGGFFTYNLGTGKIYWITNGGQSGSPHRLTVTGGLLPATLSEGETVYVCLLYTSDAADE